MKRRSALKLMLAAGLLSAASLAQGASAETVKIAVGQRGNWDTAVAELGQKAGIFKSHGLELEILYTQGGGETQQAVISGSADVGVAAGTLGVLGAFSKGAPVRILGAEATGAADFWYVRADSKLKSIKDATEDTTIAYSTNGSSTNSIVLAFMKEFNLKAKPTATGSPPATFTQVMSGQIDVGWSSPPFGFDAIDEGKIRIIARANDAQIVHGTTIRMLITNAAALESKKDTLTKFMKAYRETIDWMYKGEAPLKAYSEFAKCTEAQAKRIRDEFFPKALIDPDKVVGLDKLMEDAVSFKTIAAPLTKEQQKQLIQIPPRS
jgi:ABC-type nitrate/sulfonate/bicarbonate transport system substrate-binding protein